MRSLVASVLIALIVVVSVVNGSARVKRQACRSRNGGCEQGCRMLRGRRQCHCNRGYVVNSDKQTCSDIDECKSGFCQQICTNTIGSFKCSCRGGSILLSDGRSCGENPLSCAENNGECQQLCLEGTAGPSSCSCSRGYELGPDERSCLDFDECTSGRNDCNPATHYCVNTGGSFECHARVASSSCGANNGGCEQRCIQEGRGIRCDCQRDIELQADGKSCLKIPGLMAKNSDPCAQNKGGCDQICANNNGVADCKCRPGFMLENQKCRGHDISVYAPKCGRNVSKSLYVRVVGGSPAGLNNWPWMAALLDTQTSKQFCGGTLITLRHILTAAHCIDTRQKTNLTVRLGEYDLSTPDETDHVDTLVQELIIHKRYEARDYLNDIGIIRITPFDSFNLVVWPACLPPPNNQFEDNVGYITGWGKVRFGGPVSQVLLETVVPVWNHSACVKAFPNTRIVDTMMCAGVREGGGDSCQSDSGGPLLLTTEPHVWHLAGIISWGIQCGAPNRPGIYTRVNRYLPWIYQNTIL